MPLPEENKRLAVRWHDATLPPLSKTHALLVFQWGFFLSISKNSHNGLLLMDGCVHFNLIQNSAILLRQTVLALP